jgi:hypothetical protein
MIKEFYADNQLYLDFLEISEEQIPQNDGKVNKQELLKLVESNFRKLARTLHPDYGGSETQFQFLLQCKSKLLGSESSTSDVLLRFDDSKYFSFDGTSMASTLGNQLFDLLSMWQVELNIKPLFKPTKEEDQYEWIFGMKDSTEQLCLNVQNLSSELAELSSSLYEDKSLSVLVCLFIMSKKLTVTKVAYDNSVVYEFNDKIFIESSNSQEISKYFSSFENLKNDLEKVKNGTFESRKNTELKAQKSESAIEKDKKILEMLQNIKLFSTDYDESAADFLKDL